MENKFFLWLWEGIVELEQANYVSLMEKMPKKDLLSTKTGQGCQMIYKQRAFKNLKERIWNYNRTALNALLMEIFFGNLINLIITRWIPHFYKNYFVL